MHLITVTFRLEAKLQQMEDIRKQQQRYSLSILRFVIVITCKDTPFTFLLLSLECYQRKMEKLKGILRYQTQYYCSNVQLAESRI